MFQLLQNQFFALEGENNFSVIGFWELKTSPKD